MDIHGKSVDMDMDMDGKYHIHGKPGYFYYKSKDLHECNILNSYLIIFYFFFWEKIRTSDYCFLGNYTYGAEAVGFDDTDRAWSGEAGSKVWF